MHGQALHFKWGDGAKFECKELTQCFKKGSIGKKINYFYFLIFSYLEKLNGKFKSVNRWRRSESVIEKEYDDGWYVGETSKRDLRSDSLDECLRELIKKFFQKRTWNILLFEW